MSEIKAYYEVSTCTSGQFRKDGSFYFLSNRSGMSQIWKAFPHQEPVQVTNTCDRVWSYHVSPNGKDAFLSMDKGGNENEQIFYVKEGCDEPIDLTRDTTSRNQFGGVTPDGKTVIYASNARSKANFDICSVNVDTLEKLRLQKEQSLKRENNLQNAVLSIKERFGRNAVMKGINYQENSTAIERNGTVGGHKA